MISTKILSCKAVFSIDNKKIIFPEHQIIILEYDGSCDTEDWSNNSAVPLQE